MTTPIVHCGTIHEPTAYVCIVCGQWLTAPTATRPPHRANHHGATSDHQARECMSGHPRGTVTGRNA